MQSVLRLAPITVLSSAYDTHLSLIAHGEVSPHNADRRLMILIVLALQALMAGQTLSKSS